MRCNASFTKEVITFEDVNEAINWMRQGNETRAVYGDSLCKLSIDRNDQVFAIRIDDENDDECERTLLTKGDIEDLLDAEEIIGIFYNGDEDDDYSRFGI